MAKKKAKEQQGLESLVSTVSSMFGFDSPADAAKKMNPNTDDLADKIADRIIGKIDEKVKQRQMQESAGFDMDQLATLVASKLKASSSGDEE